MKTLTANYQNKNVKIHFDDNLVNKNWNFLDDTCRYLVITDQNLNKLYHQQLNTIPNLLGIVPLLPGESSKSLDTYRIIVTILQEYQLTKDDVLIAFGGGVITDICGFVAGTFKRGIRFISVPTSLIGMGDASIGGKCALNLNSVKNQIGLIYHPVEIIISTSFLKTLDKRQIISGMAEIAKIAIIKDAKMFDELCKLPVDYCTDLSLISNLIYKAICLKIKITEKDEFDEHKRHILNFGHTIGHIIEAKSEFELTHGEAIAMGMIAEISNQSIEHILTSLLKKLGLLTKPIDRIDYLAQINNDKKIKNKSIDLVYLDSIGHGKLKKYKLENLNNEQFWKEY